MQGDMETNHVQRTTYSHIGAYCSRHNKSGTIDFQIYRGASFTSYTVFGKIVTLQRIELKVM